MNTSRFSTVGPPSDELTKKEIMLMNFLNTKTSQEIRKTFYKEEAKSEVS